MGQIFRKQSARPLISEYKEKVKNGYYQDQNVSREASLEKSYESSLEIAEDDDDLDDEKEKMLEQYEKNPEKNMLPKIVDATQGQKRPTTVTTTYAKAPPKNNQYP